MWDMVSEDKHIAGNLKSRREKKGILWLVEGIIHGW